MQAVGVAGRYLVANLHANRGHEVARLELERARAFAEAASRPGEILVLAGDFNLRDFELAGYSPAADSIDHVLVAGAAASAPLVWPLERRERDGVLLSDHAPVELTIR